MTFSVAIQGQPAATARAEAVFNRLPVLVEYTAVVDAPNFVISVTMHAEEAAADLSPAARRIVRSIQLQN